MAWTKPMTAVTNSLLTASQFNVHVRNNLLETEGARATVAANVPRVWGGDGPNRSSEHQIKEHSITTLETTNYDEGYTDLPTVGPQVTIVTATAFLIMMSCQLGTNTTNDAYASYDIFESDASGHPPNVEAGFFESPANTSRSIQMDGSWDDGSAHSALNRAGVVQVWGEVPAKGLYTVKMVYKVSSNDATGSFAQRRLYVMAI